MPLGPDPIPHRCLFCGTTSGKRTREHLLRQKLRTEFEPSDGISYSHRWRGKLEVVHRPISQFDVVVNEVCADCNQGWLNDLETAVEPNLIALRNGREVGSVDDPESLGAWAYGRALLRTHVSPHGKAPRELFERFFETREVPDGAIVLLGACEVRMWEAGTHVSFRLQPGNGYLAHVVIGLGPLHFVVTLSYGSSEVERRAHDLVSSLRAWFPGRFRSISPRDPRHDNLHLVTVEEAAVTAAALEVKLGSQTSVDHLGNRLDVASAIPGHLRPSAAWSDIGSRDT